MVRPFGTAFKRFGKGNNGEEMKDNLHLSTIEHQCLISFLLCGLESPFPPRHTDHHLQKATAKLALITVGKVILKFRKLSGEMRESAKDIPLLRNSSHLVQTIKILSALVCTFNIDLASHL